MLVSLKQSIFCQPFNSTILSKKQLLGASHRRPGHIAMVRIPKLFQARKKTVSICHQMISKHWSNFWWGLSFLNLMPPKKQQAKEGRFQTSRESKSPAFVKVWAREARGKEVCSQSVMTSVERKDQSQSRQLKRCARDSTVWIHTVALKLLYQPIQPWLNIPCFFSFSIVGWSQFRGPKKQGSQHPTSTKRFVSRQRKLQKALLVSPFRCLIQGNSNVKVWFHQPRGNPKYPHVWRYVLCLWTFKSYILRIFGLMQHLKHSAVFSFKPWQRIMSDDTYSHTGGCGVVDCGFQ